MTAPWIPVTHVLANRLSRAVEQALDGRILTDRNGLWITFSECRYSGESHELILEPKVVGESADGPISEVIRICLPRRIQRELTMEDFCFNVLDEVREQLA